MRRGRLLWLAMWAAGAASVSRVAGAQVAGAMDASSGLDRLRVSAHVESRPWNDIQLALTAQYRSDWSVTGLRANALGVRAALYRDLGLGGYWVGVHNATRLDAGAWRAVGNTTFSLALRDQSTRVAGLGVRYRLVTRDTMIGDTVATIGHMEADSSIRSVTRRWAEVEGRVEWSPLGPGRMSVGVSVIGGRLRWGPLNDSLSQPSVGMWGHTSTVVPLGERLAVMATVGLAPSTRDAVGRARYGTLGMRWIPGTLAAPRVTTEAPRSTPMATAFAATPEDGGQYRLSVRAAGARRVEVAGDFSGWRPVPMRAVAGRRWAVTVPLAPGTYRVNVRLDGGAWTAPIGLPTVEDEFNGRVALIVVR